MHLKEHGKIGVLMVNGVTSMDLQSHSLPEGHKKHEQVWSPILPIPLQSGILAYYLYLRRYSKLSRYVANNI